MKVLLELRNVGFAFSKGEASVFAPLQLTITEGESIGIAGDNGSGKSTLMRVMASLITPTQGQIDYRGRPIQKVLSRYRQAINYSAGAPLGFYPRLSGIENLLFFSAMKNKMIDTSEAYKLCHRVGLSVPNAEKKYFQYSLGMKQRLHIARLLLEPSELLLLDEPTNGLSKEGVTLLTEILTYDLAGKTKMIVSHDHYFLKDVTTRTLTLSAPQREARD